MDHTFMFQEGAILIRRIPAAVCAQCGARTFSPAAARRIETLKAMRATLRLGEVEFVTVPAVDFERIPAAS